jgi:membrane-bound serine protease (ClpP class)
VSTIIGVIVAFVFFDMPWTLVVLGAFLVFDIFEVWIWLRWRKRRSITGAEGIIGERGRAVTDVTTEGGQVRLRGQLWKARSGELIPAGTRVEVLTTNDLVLEVRGIDTPAPTMPT